MFLIGGRHRGAVALAVLSALTLGACGEADGPATANESSTEGSSSTSEPSETPGSAESAPPGTETCETVWQEGAELARSYRGCLEGEQYVVRDALSCSSGQRMIRYGDRFYGVLGGTIHEVATTLEDDRGYRADVASCTA